MHTALLPTALVALLPFALAAPATLHLRGAGTPITVTEAQLVAISPKSATCQGGQYATECQTAAQAAGPISASFATYGITTPGAAAAVIATMAFESGDFMYNIHHFPSPNPGQGTRNMQSNKYNLEFAQSIPALATALPAAEAKGPDGVLALLNHYTDFDFGSAAWFLKTQCSADIMTGLASGTTAAYNAYVGCIGTTPSDARTAYFTTGFTVLSGKSS